MVQTARNALQPKSPMRITNQLLAFAEGALHAFQHFDVGALLLDPESNVRAFNEEARRHFGAGISLINGKPCATDRCAQIQLSQLLAQTSISYSDPDDQESAVALPRQDGRPLVARIQQFRPPLETEQHQRWLLLLLFDVDRAHRPDAQVLHEAFTLTPAEVRLVRELTGGRELAKVADSLGIRLGTARVHLSNVFAKTSTKSQPELAALLERISGAVCSNGTALSTEPKSDD
jgi:DNA-binding CsgD family transcriptional regulator